MKYRRARQFHRAYHALPAPIQEKVKKAFKLFQANPRHSSLGVKKMQGKAGVWEGRIDQFYRFVFHFDTDEQGETVCVFDDIGPHSILDK
jgi:mRNA-degrading endonuclease RelE of RelBE toxin-antitoxin system